MHRTASTSKVKILVVDDSPTVLQIETALLKAEGYETTTAQNGLEGLNALQKEHFDLIITDVDMPKLNGIKMTKKIREKDAWKDLPILMISYKDREEDSQAGIKAGANLYLSKKYHTR